VGYRYRTLQDVQKLRQTFGNMDLWPSMHRQIIHVVTMLKIFCEERQEKGWDKHGLAFKVVGKER